MTFRDRADAGRQLGVEIKKLAPRDPVVLGLPRGGVPVAFEVAAALGAPLDVLPTRKLGAPEQPEYAIGAIAPDALVLANDAVREMGIPQGVIDRLVATERRELERQATLFRAGRPPLDLAGKTVILVDDGLATGASAKAAIQSIRRHRPAQIILAVPVAPPEAVRELAATADRVLALEQPGAFRAVSLWYGDFRQTTDREVIDLLASARSASSQARPA